MTPDDQPNFDDPRLKAAIRQAWGHERAPAELRSRIESLLTQETSANPARGDAIRVAPSFWRRTLIGIAAVLVVGVGLVAVQMSKRAGAATVTLPAELSANLVKTHDSCIRFHPTDHHLFETAPKDNYKLIAERMGAELKYPVIATAMGHDWDFHGAALCPVGNRRVAHLMYARGDAYVSVFSLPAAAFPNCPDHQCCDAAVNGHPVACFAESGAFYCVVASTGGKTPIDLPQIRAMRDQLRGDVIAMQDVGKIRYATASALGAN